MNKGSDIRRCRLCACEEGSNNFMDIFDNLELNLEIKITKLLPIVVLGPWDPMPHVICQDCVSKLNAFNDFYESFLKAERSLRTLLPSDQNDTEPIGESTTRKLRSRKCQSLESPPTGVRKKTNVGANGQGVESYAKKIIESFIINQITATESVYTCKGCIKTFTEQSAAMNHSCVNLNVLKSLEKGTEKTLPPLRIPLFSVRSGMFVCHLCQTPFEKKTDLTEHLKNHFEGDVREDVGKKRKGRAGNDDLEKADKKKPKKLRKSSETPKQRREKAKECPAVISCNSDSPKTVDRMTQYSEEVSEESSPEMKDKGMEVLPCPDGDSVEMLPVGEPERGIFETEWNLSPSHRSDGNETDVDEVAVDEVAVDEVAVDEVTVDEADDDEVTILKVVSNRTPTNSSSCTFCDKTFATKDAFIAHQNRHLKKYSDPGTGDAFLCCVCAMWFTDRKALLNHEQFHRAEEDTLNKIWMALASQRQRRTRLLTGGRGVLTISLNGEVPQDRA